LDHAASPARAGVKIGSQVRHYRLVRRLMLRTLAEQAGCSESLLSRIENNLVTPSLSTLHRICKVLNVGVAALLEETADTTCTVYSAGERPVLARAMGSNNIEAEAFTPNAASQLLEGLIVVLEQGGHSEGEIAHDGEECGYIIEGEMELVVAGKIYNLSPGDTFAFKSSQTHSYRNTGSGPTRIVWVNTPPTF
jgi:transcriptional regulator with XRE-family HTH domain